MILPADAIRVLIVDDHSSMRTLVARCLQRLGFKKIFYACGGKEALATAERERVHLVISDYHMPDMDGLQLLSTIRQHSLLNKVGFIMLSGCNESAIVQRADELGAHSYIIKPFSVDDLRIRIESLMESVVFSSPRGERLQSLAVGAPSLPPRAKTGFRHSLERASKYFETEGSDSLRHRSEVFRRLARGAETEDVRKLMLKMADDHDGRAFDLECRYRIAAETAGSVGLPSNVLEEPAPRLLNHSNSLAFV